jgi:hypothetical protein
MTRCAAKNPSTGRRCVKQTNGTWCSTHAKEVEEGRLEAARRAVGEGLDNLLQFRPQERPLEGFSGSQALPCAADYFVEDLVVEIEGVG